MDTIDMNIGGHLPSNNFFPFSVFFCSSRRRFNEARLTRVGPTDGNLARRNLKKISTDKSPVTIIHWKKAVCRWNLELAVGPGQGGRFALLWEAEETSVFIAEKKIRKKRRFNGFLPSCVTEFVPVYSSIFASWNGSKRGVQRKWNGIFPSHSGLRRIGWGVITDFFIGSTDF